MPHGAPDDSNVRKEQSVYSLSDLAELAARLGSVLLYRRSGDVLFMDDFENGLGAWYVGKSGTNSDAALSNDYVLSGSIAVFLDSGTGASPEVRITHTMCPPVLGRVGFAIAFSPYTGLNTTLFEIMQYDGTKLTRYGVVYDWPGQELRYRDVDGSEVAFATDVQLRSAVGLYHQTKLVVNLSTKCYVEFILNDTEYALDNVEAWQQASTTPSSMDVSVMVRGALVVPHRCYVDNAVVTQNEP